MVSINMRHYRPLNALLLAILLLTGGGIPSAHEEISLQLKWKHAFQFAGFYMAVEKGYYDQRELDVRLLEGGPGMNPIEHANTGDGHYGITDTGIILARNSGKQVKALAAIFQHSPLALAVASSSGIKTFTDLKGKRAMMQSEHMDAVILAAMKKAGVNAHDFTRQNTSFNIEDLIQGNTDAFSVYITDQPHQLKQMGFAYNILSPGDIGIDFYGDILITSDDETRNHPARVQAFIEASLKGWDYALNHIDETIDLIQRKYNTQNLPQGQLYFEAYKTSEMVLKDVVNLGYMSLHRWQKITDTYAELGLISLNFPVSEMLYKAEPGFADVLKQYRWQLSVFGLIALLLIFGLQSFLLKKMVRSRTEELTESETRFRTLVANLPGTSYRCRCDDAWTMNFISDAIEIISGYPANDFLDNQIRSFNSIIHPDDQTYVRDKVMQSVRKKNAFTIEYRIVHADGELRWVHEQGQPIFNKQDELMWLDGNIFDITERKQIEKLRNSTSTILEMIASNNNLDHIFNEIVHSYEERYTNMKASILLLKDGHLYKAAAPSLPDVYNDAIEGIEIGPMVGSCGSAAFNKERTIVEDIEHDPRWEAYTSLVLPLNLRACWSEPIFNASGEVLGTFAMYYDRPCSPRPEEIEDISNAAKLSSIAIERDHTLSSLQKVSQAIEQTAEVITITDNNSIIEYVNSAFSRVTGFTAEESIGKTPLLFRSEDYRDITENIRDTITSGETWQGKVIEKKKDGTTYPAMLTISPVRNEVGKITHYIGVHEDLTKLEQMEEQFRQAQKMESIGTLVGGIAHDFNNMLAGITGNLYLARQAAKTEPQITEKLGRIEALTGRATDMIKQLLTFANRGLVQKSTLPLTSFLKETMKLHRVSVPENISLNLNILDNMQVSADMTQLQQLLLNLITNARDAVAGVDQPRIDIQLQRFTVDAAFRRKHQAATQKEYAHLSVSDNGHGISQEHLDQIFEPFYSTKEVGKGTGLGLAMVFGALKSHDGFVEVDSSLNSGSTFHIYLPLLQGDSAKPEHSEEEIIYGHGETILLVDDEEDVLDTIGEVLCSLGYSVLKAENGDEALTLFEEQSSNINMIITDVVMPKSGGVQLAEKVRTMNQDIPILFATGYDDKLISGLKQQLDHSETLVKPFTIELLTQTIKKLFDS
ncbi:ABC transporter substrate-binding protein [Mariprofundus micogutta]|nr:ABC transporter substrate-binding protein [Mariprofundus micogutta]